MSEEDKLRDYLKRTRAELLATRKRLQERESAAKEPIAIVSMACRYPGGVRTPEDLWDVVAQQRDATGPFPTDRGWPLGKLIDSNPDTVGTSYASTGGFLYSAADFDPDLFGIGPREALTIDPQQRQLLQTTWEVFERAGIDPSSVAGTNVGVFVGVMYNDYSSRHSSAPDGFEGYVGLGSAGSVASGRIAYTFGLHGPAVTVDTACSSSLVALHYAMQAIRRGECEQALVGGATIMATPNTFVEFSRQRGLSPDGRCKAYSAAADGTGWAEGVGLILIEPLSRAVALGHHVHAVIRGSAVNSDGASTQLSAPSGAAQQRVIRAALADAGVDPADVDAVEGHGTGTALGDPIEAGALAATYGSAHASTKALRLGSIKSNIGHTQAAAGVAGVIKMTLALNHSVLPATLYADPPSPHVDWSDSGLALLTDSVPWAAHDQPRRAAVSSFGISGTNAHVVIEEAPLTGTRDSGTEPGAVVVDRAAPAVFPNSTKNPLPLVLSGASADALAAQARRLQDHLARGDAELADTAYSLWKTRAQLPYRAVVVGNDRAELASGLTAIETGQPSSTVAYGEAVRNERPVFVFPGQGGQWPAMAAALLESSPVFSAEIEKVAQAFAPHLDRDVRELISASAAENLLTRVDYVQPALFAMMAGLAALWRSAGVTPAAVIGHSQGEIAAAYVAGALELSDAAAIVAARSRAAAGLGGDATMASIAVAVNDIRARIASDRSYHQVGIAAINSPTATVVAGPREPVTRLVESYAADEVPAKVIPVDYASHSSQVDPVREELIAALASIRPRSATIPFYSTVTASRLDGGELDNEYWFSNLREPVQFADTVGELAARYRVFVEISPHPVLTGPLSDIAEDITAIGTVRRDHGGLVQFLTSVGQAHAAGVSVDWSQFAQGDTASLPTYPFQERRFWLDTEAAPSTQDRRSLSHPLLTALSSAADGAVTVSGAITPDLAWTRAHRVEDRAVLPAAAVVDLAVSAAAEAGFAELATLTLLAPIDVDSDDVELQVIISTDGHINGFARGDSAKHWYTVFTARAIEGTELSPSTVNVDIAGSVVDLSTPLGSGTGVYYGPQLHTLAKLYQSDLTAVAVVSALEPDSRHALIPQVLDGALQAVYRAHLVELPASAIAVPYEFVGVRVHRAAATEVTVRLTATPDGRAVSVAAVDSAGQMAWEIERVEFREWERQSAPSTATSVRAPVRLQLASTAGGGPADLLALVRSAVAGVLGYDSPGAVRPDRPFRDLGIDSLSAVALRDHLSRAIDIRLPASTVFDYPTPKELANHLQQRLSGIEESDDTTLLSSVDADDPVVIVSMGCHYPGGVDDPEQLWNLVEAGGEAIGDFPDDRGWNLDALFHDDPDHPGTSYVRKGGFLYNAADFDAEFFELNPREARAADPQQRLLLQTAWETVERAGIDPTSLRGSATGVFLGLIYTEYGARARHEPGEHGGYLGTGSAGSVASGRISYSLGLQGPAITVDTACSSSLVALHTAAKALRDGECELALVGGATVMATPDTFVEFSRQRGLSTDGRCRAFSDDADGTGFSEGVGMLLVERLSRARAEGHPVLAVLRGSAINSDGASNGLTAPNGPAQEKVIRAALRSAGLTPADVDAVEAHGTGTTLGDPIEAHAVINTYGRQRDSDPLWLGSLKSNIGHTQAAAGVGGIIKMVQAMVHQKLPKTLHVQTRSTRIDWGDGVELLANDVSWPAGGRTRRFGVSAFGMSGTNAHVIFEEPLDVPAPVRAVSAEAAPWPVALPLSAKTAEGVRRVGRRLRDYLHDGGIDDSRLPQLAATLSRRAQFEHRAVVVAVSVGEAISGLNALANGRSHPSFFTGRATEPIQPVFVYPGQGAQWAGMASTLIGQSPVFASRIAECAAALDPITGWSLVDRLSTGDFRSVDEVQPALWATMIALTALWESFGVRPAAVVGHSQGEIAGATAAGMLDIGDSAAIAAVRSKALRAIAGTGAMGSIAAPAESVAEVIGELAASAPPHAEGVPNSPVVSIAAYNGPAATVIAGAPAQVAEVVNRFDARGVPAKLIDVDYASHSAQVESIADQLRSTLPTVVPRQSDIACYSTVFGKRLDGSEAAFDAEYWYDNLRRPVLLDQAVRAALDDGHRALIEISPHPVLVPTLQDIVDDRAADDILVTGSVRRDEGDIGHFLTSVARAWVQGLEVDWTKYYTDTYGTTWPITDIPGYAFERHRYWLNATEPRRDRNHPLISSVVTTADTGATLLSGEVSIAAAPWLADHAVAGTVLVAGAVVAELVAHAAAGVGATQVDEVILQTPLVIEPDRTHDLQVIVTAAHNDGHRDVSVHSRRSDADAWITHAVGTASVPSSGLPQQFPDVWPPDGAATAVPVGGVYAGLEERGYQYGPAFAGLRAVWLDGDDIYAEVQVPPIAGFALPPTALDAALHALGPGGWFADNAIRLPFVWQRIRIAQALRTNALRIWLHRSADEFSLRASDDDGNVVLDVAAVVLRPVDVASISATPLLHVAWEEPRHSTAVPQLCSAGPVIDGTINPEKPIAEQLSGIADLLRQALVDPESTPIVRTTGAVAARSGESVDPAAAAVWGLVRSIQSEEPGRIRLVDVESTGQEPGLEGADNAGSGSDLDTGAAIAAANGSDEPQLAVRGRRNLVPRLRALESGLSVPAPRSPDNEAGWQLRTGGVAVDDLQIGQPTSDQARALGADEVRIELRAVGLNFRDAMLALGMYPGDAELGLEGAGVVREVGSGVHDVVPGDAVMGLIDGGIGPITVTDRRLVVRIPTGMSYAAAAAVPAAFLTAWYALFDLAQARAGQSVLIHSAAGGVGSAAIQLARRHGLTVYATASPPKWEAVRNMGIPLSHIANSRDPKFVAQLDGVAERGVDIVLNSLTGEFIDASLALLPPDGRFIEMGKTDIRVPAPISGYRAFDLVEAGTQRISEILGELSSLFAEGDLHVPPVTAWPVSRAADALRYLSAARHVGKVVLTLPRAIDPSGTVLITGAPGGVGSQVARYLVTNHGVRRLLLLSRRGENNHAAAELGLQLRELGAHVDFAAADVADYEQVRAAVEVVPAGHRLTAIVHAAGVLDDVTLAGLRVDRIDAVLRPKLQGAENLDRLTRDEAVAADVASFVLFSSAAGQVGNPGQASYAAANMALDAIAVRRVRAGLPGLSIAWGLWSGDDSAMTGQLNDVDRGRIERSGLIGFSAEQAFAMFERSLAADWPDVVAIRLDRTRLARLDNPPSILRGLVASRAGERAEDTQSIQLPSAVAELDRSAGRELVAGVLRDLIAAVLGLGGEGPDTDDERSFKELGFDSLTSVELRNRLGRTTGLRLSPTVVFDHPTPNALAGHVYGLLMPEAVESVYNAPVSGGDGRTGSAHQGATSSGDTGRADYNVDIGTADMDELFAFIDSELRP